MKLHDQKTIEAKVPEIQPVERKDESLAHSAYCSPEMFLVGKAKRLVAGYPHGNDFDQRGQYFQYF